MYFNYGLFILRGHNRSRYSAISQKTLPPSHYILYLHLYRINTQSMVPKKPKVYFALSCFDIIAGFDYASTSRVYKKKRTEFAWSACYTHHVLFMDIFLWSWSKLWRLTSRKLGTLSGFGLHSHDKKRWAKKTWCFV